MPALSAEQTLGRLDRRNLDLKWALVGRIALISLLCAVGAAAFVMHDVAAKTKRWNTETVEAVQKQLRAQLLRIDRATDLSVRFPDWEIVTRYTLHPGQCVRFADANTDERRSSCLGADVHGPATPEWFANIYRLVFFSGSNVSVPLEHKDALRGTVEADINPDAVVGSAWSALKQVSGALAVLTAILCILVYGAISHALRPANEILTGVNRLSGGDLSYRLPSFRLRELHLISTVLNELSQSLQVAMMERSELARKLIDAQERERRALSLELHDDVAQRLTALSLLARSVQEDAKFASPAVAAECAELAAMASVAMRALRSTLACLRPPEIDDLGLRVALRELVAERAQRAGNQVNFALQIDDRLDELPSEAAVHVYRIVQEGLTNAIRHSNARNIEIILKASPRGAVADVQMTIADDGRGAPADLPQRPPAGIGLLGMRERVFALNGQIAIGTAPSQGFRLQVSFPTALIARETT